MSKVCKVRKNFSNCLHTISKSKEENKNKSIKKLFSKYTKQNKTKIELIEFRKLFCIYVFVLG